MKAAAVVSGMALVGLLAASVVRAEAVVTPKVVTDKSVDCSSMETILKDVLKPGMSDKEKALALYHWFRRVVYPHRCMGADRRNVLRVINSYGYDLCGSQAGTMLPVWQAAGFKARAAHGNAGKEMGHTFVEVFYGEKFVGPDEKRVPGKWHCLDTMTSFYVYNREDPPTIASLAELKADPTLVTKAKEEGRCGPEFLYTVGHNDVSWDLRQQMQADGMKADIAWTLLVIRPDKEGNPQSILTFWEKGPKGGRSGSPESTYGGHYVPGLCDITLKPNEEFVRLWDNVGKYVVKGTFAKAGKYPGPYHTPGSADEHDPVNFKYFEPYKKTNYGYNKVTYRYYANGWLDWTPQGAEIVQADGVKVENLDLDEKSGSLTVVDAGKPALISIPVKSPYVVVESALDLDVRTVDPSAKITVSLQPAASRYDRKAKPLKESVAPRTGPVTVTFDQGSRTDMRAAALGYTLNVEVAGGSAAFAVRRLKTTFQHNMQSQPYLVPGENTVTVSAETKALKAGKLVVTYEWDEGEGWKDSKTLTKEVTTFPTSFTIDVAGPKMPRMKKLTMKVVPD